jgi:dCMP deaminase
LNEVHAEINAILYAAKKGIAIDNSVLYCTLMPCNNCLKAICSSGIKKVYYSDIYDRTRFTPNIITLLRRSGIKLIYTGDFSWEEAE